MMCFDEWTEIELNNPIWLAPAYIVVKAPHEEIAPILNGLQPTAQTLIRVGQGKDEIIQYYIDNLTEAGYVADTKPYFQTYQYNLIRGNP